MNPFTNGKDDNDVDAATNGGPVDPRTAALIEATGHPGPWTSDEYQRVFPPVNVPEDDELDPPGGVQRAQEALDEARGEFEEADGAWRDAVAEARRIRAKMDEKVTIDPNTGRMIVPGGHKMARKLQRLHDLTRQGGDLHQDRQVAAEALQRARGRYTKRYSAWRRELQQQRTTRLT